MIASVDEARALLAKRGVIPLVSTGEHEGLVDLVAGEHVKGSWWGHRAGKRIFHVASELENEVDAITAKILDGKVTFVDSALFAPLFRIVTDRAWRASRTKALPEKAQAALRALRWRSPLDEFDLDKKAKDALERSLLVHSFQVHTEAGSHATMIEFWGAWALEEIKEAALALDFEDACAVWRKVCRGSKTALLDKPSRVTKS